MVRSNQLPFVVERIKGENVRITCIAIVLSFTSGMNLAATAKPSLTKQEAVRRHLTLIFSKELNPETVAGVNLGRGYAITTCGKVRERNVYIVEQDIVVSFSAGDTSCELATFFIEDKGGRATELLPVAIPKKGSRVFFVHGPEKQIVQGSILKISAETGNLTTDIDASAEDIGAGLWSENGLVGIIIKTEPASLDDKKTYGIGISANKVEQIIQELFPTAKK